MQLGLGTVQFGLDYGIANARGMTPRPEVERILALAGDNGIRVLDTATMYGDSEAVLGITLPAKHDFKIVTKTPNFKTGRITDYHVKQLRSAFANSLEKMKQDKLYGLLLHHADDLLCSGGELLFEEMKRLVAAGLVEKIGISVYDGSQIDSVLSHFVPDLIQLPVSIFDQRLIRDGHLEKLKNLGVEIHARSVFLQGLLLMNPASIPDYFAPLRDHFRRFEAFLQMRDLSRIQGALLFAAQQPELDTVLVGVCSAEQLGNILNALRTLPQDRVDMARFAWSDERYLNPSNWQV